MVPYRPDVVHDLVTHGQRGLECLDLLGAPPLAEHDEDQQQEREEQDEQIAEAGAGEHE